MIDEIQVTNLALIKEASMTPSRRLTVLTGETGAGKTALLSACKLLMGARADKSAVREGESEARVQGRFYLDSTFLGEGFDEADGEGERARDGAEEELVVNRRLGADGRSRVSVNGSMASVSELAKLVGPSIDLCGQHEHQTLMKPSNHVVMLDAWAGDTVSLARVAYKVAFAEARAAQKEYQQCREAAELSSAQLDEARFVLRQIDAVGVVEGEYEELVELLGKSEHAESLAMAANEAYDALSGENGAIDAVTRAAAALQEASRHDASLGEYASSLYEVSYVLEDVARDSLAYRDSVEYDADQLTEMQDRVGALQGLMRTYGPRIQDVIARREEAFETVSAVDEADEREQRAKHRMEAAELALADCAKVLHEARGQAAPRFAAEVSSVMARLQMGSAELECHVDMLARDAWTAAGPNAVEFFFRPGSGMQARPLARIASGGEISRVMLAVKVVLGADDAVSTLVFDEVDAGVGGATALALAEVLSALAETHQVIVVTHLAQIAVAADCHYVVRKTDAEVPETKLFEVCGEDRVGEVARMLSGSDTQASRAHAREMLARGA